MKFINISEDEYISLILKKINFIMIDKGIKQLDLSERSNIGQSTLSKLLKGEMKLTLQHIVKICKALEVDPDYLLSTNESTNNSSNSEQIKDSGVIYKEFLNDQILIRDTRHLCYKGYINNSFNFYCFSTISSESDLLEGVLDFSDTNEHNGCKASLSLCTGQINREGDKVFKKYTGELIISLAMGACYCILINSDIGEICLLNFKHTFLFNQELECRVGAIVSTSSGGNRLPIMQRVLISKQKLNVNDVNDPDYVFIRGQLNLNDSLIYISKDLFDELRSDKDGKYHLEYLKDFFDVCDSYMETHSYNVIDESKVRESTISSDIKIQGISALRKYSTALKYNKISTKTEEFVFQYINSKKTNKNSKQIKE